MIRRTLTVFGILGLAFVWAAPARAAITTSEDLQRVCDEWASLGLDETRVFDIKNATLTRDIGTIRMKEGVLVFTREVEGITPAAVFVGEGQFTLTPGRRMDREMLEITAKDHLGADTGGMINTGITEAFLVGFHGTWDALETFLSGPRAATPREMEKAGAILEEQLRLEDKVTSFSQAEVAGRTELGIIGMALGDPLGTSDSLRVEMKTEDYREMVFAYQSGSTYEVRMGIRRPIGQFLIYHPLVVAHKKGDLDRSGKYVADPVEDLKEIIKVKSYRMNLEVPNLERIKIDVDVTFTPKEEGLNAAGFLLVNDVAGPRWDSRAKWVDILSVTDSEGNELPHIHRKHVVLVLLNKVPEVGENVTLSFKLDENTITQFSDNHFSLLNTYPWFPQYGYLGGQYEFDWTVKTVKPYSATGSGKVLNRWEEDKLNAVRMVFDRPVQVPSIIFGRYQGEESEFLSKASGKTMPVAAHSWPQTRFTITDATFCSQPGVRCPFSIEVNVPRKKPADVIEEGKIIIEFLEDLYGPFPYEKLDVAMMSPGMGFGQAPPAFVQLTGEAFMSSATLANNPFLNPDFFHDFFAHEIAHQWWGHKIGWIADEDVWLSESFAEYSAGLYVLGLQGESRYQAKMREWKENAKIGDPHGSIAWCNNLSGPNGNSWRTALVYNKGPYVVHMLRKMMGMEKFKKAMKDVFAKHGYSNVTTAAIQQECETQVGYSLDFFFDQWFRGTGIPIFDYSWDAQKNEDGKYLVTVTASQRDKKNFKQVLMPIYFHFKGSKAPLVSGRGNIRPWAITSAESVYRVIFDKKPTKIVLDENHDILGDMIPQGSGI